jgi:precorrin-6B methylase 2
MTPNELFEHRGYLADERKIAAYQAALDEVVGPDDTVLDLGAGTGILGLLACRAGAGHVIAVDQGDIIDVARDIAVANGLADRITHVKAMSTDLELDDPVDVVVCDQIGGLVHDAGVLSAFADARRRLLADGGRMVPESFRVFVAPVGFGIGRQAVDFWRSAPAGFDVTAARRIAANTEWKFNVVTDDLTALAAPSELAAFPADHEGRITGALDFEVETTGTLDGWLGWFEARLSPSVTLTNDPWSPERFDRWCNFYALEEAVEVAAGDRLSLTLDLRPKGGVVSWTTGLRDGERRFKQSTFFTATRSDLFGHAAPVASGDRIPAMRRVLDLIDGQRSLADILTALGEPAELGFASRNAMEAFVEKVTGLAG